jgi:hypothetical protein
MKFRQAKKIIHGNSSIHDKYRKRRPPYINEEGKRVWPSLHDIDIIRRAMRVFLHHYKRHKRKELG